ncbi:MAG: UDP-3-O-(3-hydroxymyristoyl)glucosamine N-acyltransferase [Halobacteriovoraceae bacterium]|nr:UDP-3-O-(3-hydroxymyristoyl)glucosamine N-acyltransferase [Halobacteriovoraceae bacterium]|tara:strand:+ start:22119 stop:23147 length:1029 start_codon:yes stop_codon:yes gene_type:complete
MKFSELKSVGPSLNLKFGEEDQIDIHSISTPSTPLENTFVFIKNKKFLESFLSGDLCSNLGAVFTNKLFETLDEEQLKELKEKLSWLATVESVEEAMCAFSKPFYDQKFSSLNLHVDGRQMGSAEIDPSAEIAQNVFIGEGVKVGPNVTIMPGCVIMSNSEIGAGTILFPNVTIYPYTSLGGNCRIHSNTTIGSDGFGYNFLGGEHKKVWHFGGVVIKDNVEIGANSAVDAGAFTPTFIDSGTKIDNFCQVAHNSKVGKHCVICGRAGVAGSVTLDDYVIMGAGSGCAPGAHLKTGTQVAAMGIVSENAVWGPKAVLAGHPARPLKEWLRTQAKINILTKKK